MPLTWKDRLADRLPVPRGIFWRYKINAPEGFDVVLAGSSRVCRGVSPRQLGRVLPGRRILNFGFHSCVLDRAYLDHCRRLLAGSPSGGVLVLGISPHTLIRRPNVRNLYAIWSVPEPRSRRQLCGPRLKEPLAGLLRKALRPLRFLKAQAPGLLADQVGSCPGRAQTEPVIREGYRADGWLPTGVAGADPLDYVRRLESVYARYQVESGLVQEMLQAVRDFSAEGVKVFAFNPPTNQAMRELEARASGLGQAALINDFRAAGGVWLAIDEERFPAYDGSHLDRKSALNFSRHLARRMLPHLTGPAAQSQRGQRPARAGVKGQAWRSA